MAETYKIGEAAKLLNLKAYVLRFWESEFPDIVPLRTAKGQRLYAVEHLALLERIRYLLHDRGMTIEGTRRVLAEEKSRGVVYSFDPSSPQAEPHGHYPLMQAPLLQTREYDQSGDASPRPLGEQNPAPVQYRPAKEDYNAPAWLRERQAEEQRLSQQNLPGIGHTPPSGPPLQEAYATVGNSQAHNVDGNGKQNRHHLREQPSLPLFSPAPDSAVPLKNAGGSVIQTAPSSSPPAFPDAVCDLQEALDERDAALLKLEAHTVRSRADLMDILGELESIASLLRG